ncbi:hypothetical protein BVRB_4g087760 [Beta vulgaris subsp. vulgaris]|nr:hypothetical protein BVRB_4g087760 [Beta vulgaris subsp. vulgaris]
MKKMKETRTTQKNQEEDNTIIEVREELMISPTSDVPRKAHFIKPSLHSKNNPLPKSPFPILSSNPNIKEFTKKVSFKGRPKPQNSWKEWVESLLQIHQKTWKKVGIFDAIRISTYNIKRYNELVVELAAKWCIETNTFVFSWGEATITLEDVMILGGFSVLGYSVVELFHFSKMKQLKEEMVHGFAQIRRSNKNNQVSHYNWMNYFKGKGGELEHVAILVLWLSRYVFSTNFYNIISQNLFDLAINLAMGTQIALAPAVLAAIYRDLRLLKQNIVSFTCKKSGDDHVPNLTVWALFQFVQLWAWERFPNLSPEPGYIARGEPRLARWHGKGKLKFGSLQQEIECAAGLFCWKPYALKLRNWKVPKIYCESDQGKWVVLDSEMDEELVSFARCLRPCELVGIDCVEQYLPHRVGMQFGFDQDVPNFVPRSNDDIDVAWSSYCEPLDGLKLYLPPRLFEGDITVQYLNWWRNASPHDQKVKEVKRSNTNMNVGSTSSEDPETNTVYGALVDEGEQDEQQMNTAIDDLMDVGDTEDDVCELSEAIGLKVEDTQQMNTSIDDLVILSDTDDDLCDPFQAIALKLDDRISELEQVVSVIRATKRIKKLGK